ncbi:hypothetical protein PSP31120_02632 [Pandoraea sputorum]|nr:hypothetical protein PSP31120_02632 [Pandoraea sputorum]
MNFPDNLIHRLDIPADVRGQVKVTFEAINDS